MLTEGVPLDYEILKQCLWSIDRTMSNRVLQYWILKFRPFMRYLDLIQCDEFLYLLTNTVAKNQLVSQILRMIEEERSKERKEGEIRTSLRGFSSDFDFLVGFLAEFLTS